MGFLDKIFIKPQNNVNNKATNSKSIDNSVLTLETLRKERDEMNRRFEQEYNLVNIGIEAEKSGDIDKAIEVYENLVDMKFDGSHPYKQLAVIYHKKKLYNDEKRVILAYRDRNPKLFDTDERKKYEWFRKRLKEIETK